ncbi:MAG: PIG-L deacetylase family protein [Acidimicrobiales bacterium]
MTRPRLADLASRLVVPVGRRLPANVRRLANVARGIDTPALVDRPPGRRVAVLAPHPDDELLGCGGTLVKHLAAGEAVAVVFMTSGERTASFAGRPVAECRAQREAEAAAALSAAGLGRVEPVFLRIPEGEVDGHGARLAAALARLQPDLVYAPHPVDAHRDHAATTVLLARLLPGLGGIERVALYEVWTPLYPNVVVDVTGAMDAKLAGLACYRSAMEVVDYARTAAGLGAYRSGQTRHGQGYAEAFCVLGRAAFLELVGLLVPGPRP